MLSRTPLRILVGFILHLYVVRGVSVVDIHPAGELRLRRGGSEIEFVMTEEAETTGAIHGRRADTSNNNYGTQTEIVLCLVEGASPPDVASSNWGDALISTLQLQQDVSTVRVFTDVTKCVGTAAWQMEFSIWNVATATESAGATASIQVDSVYINEDGFLQALITAVNSLSGTLLVPTDFVIDTLGFLIIWLDYNGAPQGVQPSASSQQLQPGMVIVGGSIVYWPTYFWYIYAILVVFFFIPVLAWYYMKKRRGVEQELSELTLRKSSRSRSLGSPRRSEIR